MAEYDFDGLLNEIANSKKLFAEYAFGKGKAADENAKDVFLLACENIARVYEPYGFKYSKSGRHLTLKQKGNEFVFRISFFSSHYNVPGENVVMDVFANVLSHKYKRWKAENRDRLGLKDTEPSEYICGGNIGNLRKDCKYLKWNVGKKETKEKEMESVIENINGLAIPLFGCFNDTDRLKRELGGGGFDDYIWKEEKAAFSEYIEDRY